MTAAVVFGDIETTGLTPKGGRILEIGLLAVDFPSLTIVGEYSSLAHDPGQTTEHWEEDAYKMHQRSGLLEDWLASDTTSAEARAGAVEFMRQVSEPGGPLPILGGAGVALMDHPWLAMHWPEVRACFHRYRFLDTNTFYISDTLMNGADATTPKPGTAHRALADCYASFNILLKQYT